MKREVLKFCVFSTVPKSREAVRKNNKSALIWAIVNRANKDVMSGARFHNKEYCMKKDSYMGKLVSELSKDNYFSPRECIRQLTDGNEVDTCLGSIQKLVNMAVKYCFVFDAIECGNLLPKIDYKNADCPLDSVILASLESKTVRKWTQLSSMKQYEEIQLEITNQIKKLGLNSRLEYDFYIWNGGIRG